MSNGVHEGYTCKWDLPASSKKKVINGCMRYNKHLSMFQFIRAVSSPMSITTRPASVCIAAGGSVTGVAVIPAIADSAVQLSLCLCPCGWEFWVAGLL